MRTKNQVRIYSILKESKVNGPGLRTAIYFQGCNLNCPHCINPQTHDINGGTIMTLKNIKNIINSVKNKIEGITCTGGEPFLQPKGLLEIVRYAHSLGKTVIISTGYNLEELRKIKLFDTIKKYSDVIIYGRFHHEELISTGLVGSKNKKFIFCSNVYSKEDILSTPKMELIIENGNIIGAGTEIRNLFDWDTF